LIQIARNGLNFSGTQQDLDALRMKFDRDHYVILPQLFEPTLLEEILRRVQDARFLPRDHIGIALELCMADQLTTAMLRFLPSNPAFLRIVEHITGNRHIGKFIGRVYKMNSSEGHYDSWHDDCIEHRVVTMSVNLSPQPFQGGALQLKHPHSEIILKEIHNTGLGDALLFRISPDLIHRVQGVMGDHPKIALAGWFIEGEDFLPSLGKCIDSSVAQVENFANDQPHWETPVPPKHD
jgi:2OG-Fe(II) oxygenase superfamily